MDIVYSFYNDKRTSETTLKYSLRSIEKNFDNVSNVYILGHETSFKNVIHIPVKDCMSKGRNIFTKALTAAQTPEISDKFMFISDDHYILKPCEIENYPIYGNGTLDELMVSQGNAYKSIIQNTVNLLRSKDKPTLNYNIHCPAIFEKSKIIELNEAYPLQDSDIGFITKSLYFNHFGIKPDHQLRDCKIRRNATHSEIMVKINWRDCFSTGKEDSCPNILSFLEQMFPNKSKYE